jgi:hypothetical protein
MIVSLRAFAGDSPRAVRAVHIDSPPKIDGYLNEQVWTLAAPATDFVQRDPDEGRPASERTEIRVLYDDEALYFGCMFYDSEPEKVVARLTRRDDEIESDRGSIRIDSYHDHQTGYEFTFNAAGVKVDILQYDDAEKEDESWDAVWDLQTQTLPDGWSAELRIPFRILRYRVVPGDSALQEWGINFLRYISRKSESDRWAFTPKSESGFISRFGHLEGLEHLPDPRQFDVLPFVVGKQRYAPPTPSQDHRRIFSGDAGFDLKYSLSKNFTLDATVNPDFGQVEADPAVLNLTTFETFYPEKRPFFIEGTQILRFTTFGGDLGPGMFYSRRIGRAIAPDEVTVPEGGRIEDLPQSTTILGAAKINGKTNNGLSVGILQAVTKEEKATVIDTDGVRTTQVLEPFAHYNVIRLKQDIMTNSNIGVILTSVEKHQRSPAITNGWDWYIKLDNNTYLFEGFFAHSHATTPANERIHGTAARVNFARVAAEHWLWGLGGRIVSKRFNINDVGFFFRPDGYTGLGLLTYKEDVPAQVARSYSVSLALTEFRNLAGVSLQRETRLSGNLLFSNYWQMTASATTDLGLYDDRETRGNGLYRRPATFATSTYLFSDSRANVFGKLGQRFMWDDKRKSGSATEVGATLRPLSWMDWEVELEYQRVKDQEAWVENVASSSGTQSIFGDRDTKEYDFTLRSTITFTRELTLQFYGQVFLAKGHYEDFRALIGTSDFVPAHSTDHDFNRQSLNTNLVLRWEYLPGSTLFLVWSQAREGGDAEYFRTLSQDFGDAFRVAPANVLLLKLTYLIGV